MGVAPQLLWVDTIEVAWVTFLSIVANEKKKHTEEVILNEFQDVPAVEIEGQIESRSEQLMAEAQGILSLADLMTHKSRTH